MKEAGWVEADHWLRDGVARESSIPLEPREQKAGLSLGRI